MRRLHLGFWLIVLVCGLIACGVRTTPPGPDTVFGSVEAASYTYLHWEQGLHVMLWDDIRDGSHNNQGSGSTQDPIYRQSGTAAAADGRSYSYTLETRDGITGEFTLNGRTYDLTQGSLFLITTRDGAVDVQQLERDLSAVPPTNVACEAFAQNDTAIAEFVQP